MVSNGMQLITPDLHGQEMMCDCQLVWQSNVCNPARTPLVFSRWLRRPFWRRCGYCILVAGFFISFTEDGEPIWLTFRGLKPRTRHNQTIHALFLLLRVWIPHAISIMQYPALFGIRCHAMCGFGFSSDDGGRGVYICAGCLAAGTKQPLWLVLDFAWCIVESEWTVLMVFPAKFHYAPCKTSFFRTVLMVFRAVFQHVHCFFCFCWLMPVENDYCNHRDGLSI